MTIKEQLAACATGIMGWKRYKGLKGDPDIFGKPIREEYGGNLVEFQPICDVSEYHPDTNIMQANELWDKLNQQDIDVIMITCKSKEPYCVLMGEDVYETGSGNTKGAANALGNVKKA